MPLNGIKFCRSERKIAVIWQRTFLEKKKREIVVRNFDQFNFIKIAI